MFNLKLTTMKKQNYVLAFNFNDKGTRYFSQRENSGCDFKTDTVVLKFFSKKEAAKFAIENNLSACWIESLTGKNRYNLNLKVI